jgi:hypothetical protein
MTVSRSSKARRQKHAERYALHTDIVTKRLFDEAYHDNGAAEAGTARSPGEVVARLANIEPDIRARIAQLGISDGVVLRSPRDLLRGCASKS